MKKFLIKVNGNQYEVEVEEVQTAGSAPQAAAPVSAPAPKAVEKTSVPSGSMSVAAPMPGTILKVNVSNGDSVKKGQVLLILEAMKMENEITAPGDGKIASVNVTKGSTVKAGDILVSLE